MPPKEEEIVEQGEAQAENAEVGDKEAEDVAGDKMKPATQDPTMFSDERGNLKAVNLVCRHPCKIFWFLMIFCFVISFLLQAIVFANAEDGNPFTTPENEFDLDDIRSIQYDSLRLARDEVQKDRDADNQGAQATPKQSEVADLAYWVYEAETDAGVFGTRESIQAMKDAFDIFWEDDRFPDWCLLDYRSFVGPNETRKCSTPITSLSMYYASTWDSAKVDSIIETLKDDDLVATYNTLALCVSRGLYCELVPNTTTAEERAFTREFTANISSQVFSWDMRGELIENITQGTELAAHLLKVDIFKGLVDFGFDKDFSVENPKSKYSRGIIFWGGPLEAQETDLTADEKEALEENEDEIRKDFVIDNFLDEMNQQAEEDTHASVNSYYFMIAIIGDVILQIVLQDALLAIFSLAFVFFWLRINTGSWFLAAVGFFEIAFSIPIAWFIFSVIFQIQYFATLNSLAIFIVAAIGADDIFIFMDAYKQSRIRDPENLVDIETRMSWVYRRTGTAMAITSATTCSAFLCTLITPLTSIQSFGIFAAVVILIDYVLVMTLFCTAVVIFHDRLEGQACCGCCWPCGVQNPTNTDKARQALEEAGEEPVQGDRVSRFFRNQVAGFVKKPLNRALIFVLFITWISIAIWQALQIEAAQEAEQFLNEDNPLQKSITILNNEFPTADDDRGLKVYYAWGLGEVDREGVNLLLDPTDYGEPTFVQDFDFNAQCQTELVKFCDKLKTNPDYKDLIKQRNGVGEVYCFIEELGAFNAKGDLDDCEYVTRGDWKNETWQVDPANMTDVMDRFLQQRTCFDEDGVETTSGRYADEMGWDGNKMKYAAVSAESIILTPFSVNSERVTRREYERFIAVGEEANQVISQYCSGDVIITDLDEKFVFMNNQAIYVQTALQASILGVVIAFVVLLFSTRVFHIAFFASISITSVLVSVVGTMVMLGWSLGSIESILIGIIAGFSVDYVVHLAHAYEIAEGDTYERVEEAFADLGISVFNGMVTSVAASIPLFFCSLQFFAKFGTFLCLTIAFSWIFANFVFMSILAQLKIPIKKGGFRL
ncbi:unnamed protein product [Cylindrotheca closterium]|uniref:SSD domain-containing protein n=1 Tax=Cylindrotheca closterium TaxID=2856 RepID=A0AAD2G8V8_9STRA|nr:unnamed protein product [Cylindrotheca closterium]